MDNDHPLLLELASLRQTAARFQHEAHSAAIRLQHHSLDSAHLHEHAAALEQENARLAHELGVLRAHPETQPHPAVAQAHELSLALRRVSDKLSLTEHTLLTRTSQLADAHSELSRARHTTDAAYELAARMRAREEASKARERELQLAARASEQERQMVDLVVQEYADLVRNLEGRKSAAHSPAATIADALQGGRSALHAMLTAFSTESDQLHATIANLNAQISDLHLSLEAERKTAFHDRSLLSQTKTELDKLDLEDQTAAKMVARYMKFSQASTNALQEQMTTLKTRHASTLATLELQLSITESQLTSERARTARLQDALDELCEDLARESYGRRREVALRLALISREEAAAEFMRRWARKARELYARCYGSAQPQDPIQDAFCRVVGDAESLLDALDGDVQVSDTTRASGSLARIALSREAVDALRGELQLEVQRRLEAVQRYAFALPNGTPNENIDDHLQPDLAPDQQPDGNVGPASTPELSGADSAASIVVTPGTLSDHPFIDPTSVAVQEGLPSPSIRDSASTSVTLIDQEFEPHSPAVSVLDLKISPKDYPLDVTSVEINDSAASSFLEADLIFTPMPAAPHAALTLTQPTPPTLLSELPVPLEARDNSPIPSASEISPTPAAPPSPTLPTLLSELERTKHRYNALQCAFRDCSVALKDLKRTLASLPHTTTRRHQLTTIVARIDDYCEDARVELEIQVADEQLTVRGFETVLSVPGALDVEERAEMEVRVGAFVEGDGAMARFETKLADVAHDVGVVKQVVYGLAMAEGEGREEVAAEAAAEGGHKNVDSSWTAWTAGLLGAAPVAPSRPRSPTPVQTFGVVMTSPRLQHVASRESMRSEIDRGSLTLAEMELRIPMPAALSGSVASSPGLPSLSPYRHLGLGRGTLERPGGIRSASSLGLGVGMGVGVRLEPLRGSVLPAVQRGGEKDEGWRDLGRVE